MIKKLCLATTMLFSLSTLGEQVVNETKYNESIAISPFTAQYSILHKSSPVGKGSRSLKALSNGLFEYSYQTSIEWLIFSDEREERSILTVNNNHVTPLEYHYERSGTGRDKSYFWRFDVAENKATDEKNNQLHNITFPENIQDKLSYHLQTRLQLKESPEQKVFVYPVISTSGSIKNYVYQYDGTEELMLPYGNLHTIRLKREVVEKKRITYAWFAPELDYALVKLYQSKSGAEQFEAQLTTFTKH
ncbi:DUF3108 domain-containing protein [Thalassotalea sp. 1_MG-2023]|uniref:DUF3108 domain-containing protein n=1 Tax=Thalassotalea sp. 1_MG-2023 TaxID=3062680 RepID=UPI0026E35250|nr:DUF3108 domain-containing protein [Thalassotalea sp. 1_MG-2023]MDO6428412.1 DUF3108 domain-containing protein [Thalassotalea sp. 1_MG-2023]